MAHRRSARLVLAAVAAGLATFTACGAPAEEQPADPAAAHEHHHDQEAPQPGQAQAPEQQHHHGGDGLQLWATQTASLGIVTLDGAGRIVYRSDADGNNPPVSNCTGECAQHWVPVTVPEGQAPELLGIKQDRVGTLRREDGALQVTLAGWPLYTLAGDQGTHDGTGANGADGVWFAVTPTGEKAAP
ncbi:COG4315 family predicted lipoprotein [Pseudonocardia adelaidensis]